MASVARPTARAKQTKAVSEAFYLETPICIPRSAFHQDGFRAWARSEDFPRHCRISFLDKRISIRDDLGETSLSVPVTAGDHAGFREWALSDAFPPRGRISFLDPVIFIDMSPEELETHNRVKTTITSTVFIITDRADYGALYGDGTLVTNTEAGLSTEPDATFVLWESLQSGRVQLLPRKDHPGEYLEVQGSPDWVLEVISRSTWTKDTQILREKYAKARIREYWLVDALGDQVELQILQLRGAKYIAASRKGNWQASKVFSREFQLVRQRTKLGYWRYQLKSRVRS